MANATHETEKAKGAAGQAFEKGKEAVGHLGEAAKSAAGQAVDTAKNVANAAGKKADAVTASVGSGIESLGDKVRQNTPNDGLVGQAADKVAGALEQSGKYLQEQGLTGMAEDLGEIIRRNPLPALLIGVGVGFLLARATTSRS